MFLYKWKLFFTWYGVLHLSRRMAIIVRTRKEKALQITRNYCSMLFNFENSFNKKFRNKNSAIFEMILKNYARNISTEARKSTMISDINKNDDRN